MTIIVEPSLQRGVANHFTVAAIARWGDIDWIVPPNTVINGDRAGLTGTPLNAAAITTSGLDVSIDTFEAFIRGAWLASDDNTDAEHTHTLPGSSATTTLFLGYDNSMADTIIFGPASEFSALDPKIPIADVTDDGVNVTNVDDRRPVGRFPNRGLLIESVYDADNASLLGLDTGVITETYPQYEIVIYREDQAASTESYMDLRVNGIASGLYYGDIYDSFANVFDSFDATTEWQRIAGVGESTGDVRFGGFCLQVLRINCPPEIVSNSKHYPVMETIEQGVGKNFDFVFQGVVRSDESVVNRIDLFGGANSTGFIEIYGRGISQGS